VRNFALTTFNNQKVNDMTKQVDIYDELTDEQKATVRAVGFGEHCLFAHRNTMKEAQDYLDMVAKGTESPAHVITAAMVYAHSLVLQLVKNGHLVIPVEVQNESGN